MKKKRGNVLTTFLASQTNLSVIIFEPCEKSDYLGKSVNLYPTSF